MVTGAAGATEACRWHRTILSSSMLAGSSSRQSISLFHTLVFAFVMTDLLIKYLTPLLIGWRAERERKESEGGWGRERERGEYRVKDKSEIFLGLRMRREFSRC